MNDLFGSPGGILAVSLLVFLAVGFVWVISAFLLSIKAQRTYETAHLPRLGEEPNEAEVAEAAARQEEENKSAFFEEPEDDYGVREMDDEDLFLMSLKKTKSKRKSLRKSQKSRKTA